MLFLRFISILAVCSPLMAYALTLTESHCSGRITPRFGPYGYEAALQDASNVQDVHAYLGLKKSGPEFKPRENNTIVLCDDGCATARGSFDCATACSSRDQMWAANAPMTTLQNCLVAPIISAANASGLLHDPHDLLRKYNIKQTTTVRGLAAPDGSAWQSINKCLESTSTSRSVYTMHTTYKLGNFTPELALYPINCKTVAPGINPDLGGRGMIIAFILLLCLLLAIWIAVLVKFLWRRLSRPRKTRSQNNGQDDVHNTGQSSQQVTNTEKSGDKQGDALSETATEFQKTQIFFIATLQVAILLALDRATSFDVTLLWSFSISSNLAVVIAYLGTTPAVLGLMILRRRGQLDWFMILLTLLVLLVSTLTYCHAKGEDYAIDLSRISKPAQGLSACGDWNPLQTCAFDPRNVVTQLWKKYWPAFILLAWIIFVGLVIERMWSVVTSDRTETPNKVQTPTGPDCEEVHELEALSSSSDAEDTPKVASSEAKNGSPLWSRVLFHIAELYLVGINAFLLWIVLKYTPFTESFVPGKNAQGVSLDWTFGQVIAVAIWIPVVLQWLYRSTCELYHPARSRLPTLSKLLEYVRK